jgi:hypothetical protein
MANRQGDVDLRFAQVSAPQLTLWLGLADLVTALHFVFLHEFYPANILHLIFLYELRLATDWKVRGSNPGWSVTFRILPDRPWIPTNLL